jgi:hypothetical protein
MTEAVGSEISETSSLPLHSIRAQMKNNKIKDVTAHKTNKLTTYFRPSCGTC